MIKNRGVLRIVLLVIFVNMTGIIGYSVIEGWSFLDALYMTVITLSTTGFGEVHQLSTAGRFFTMFLLTVGMGIVVYSISVIMEFVLSIDFRSRRRKRMLSRIKALSGHSVVCGFGRMGRVICQELDKAGKPFVVIERKSEMVPLIEKLGYLYIEGDASADENLILAGGERARVIISMIDNDADGLYLALSARSLNAKAYIIVRANDETAKKRILRAGANKVILPVVMSGLKVAQSVINPAVEDYLDITGVQFDDKNRLQLADVVVRPESLIIGRNLLEMGEELGKVIVVGIRKKEGEFIFDPRSDYRFEVSDCLILLSTKESYTQAVKDFKLSTQTL